MEKAGPGGRLIIVSGLPGSGIAQGLTVIIEWGTWSRSERDVLRLGAQALGAGVELHYMAASSAVLFERIQRRGIENSRINRDDISRWADAFQAPSAEEMALFDKPLVSDLSSGQPYQRFPVEEFVCARQRR